MVWMIVVEPMRHNQIRAELPNLLNNFESVFEGRFQMSVVVIQQLVFDTDDFSCRLGLGITPFSQWFTTHLMVSCVTISNRNKFDAVPFLGILGS